MSFMPGQRSHTAARITDKLTPAIGGAADVALTSAIKQRYEESPVPDVEKQLTTGNRNTLNRATAIDDIGRSDASAWRCCSPP